MGDFESVTDKPSREKVRMIPYDEGLEAHWESWQLCKHVITQTVGFCHS